jgi:hypothetical protein
MAKTPPTDEADRTSSASLVPKYHKLWDEAGHPPKGEHSSTDEHNNAQARNAVLVCGLSEGTAKSAERKGPVDWRPLAAAFDSLYVARGGSLGIRMFLMTPQKSLGGAVPAELVARGDLHRVARAAYIEAVRADRARAC